MTLVLSIAQAIGQSIWDMLRRLYQVAVNNPGYMVVLLCRMIAGMFGAREKGRRASDVADTLWRIASKSGRAIARGLLLAVGVGIAAGLGLGQLGNGLGAITRPIVNASLMHIIIGTALPIVLALVVVARHGATLAAKFSIALAKPGSPQRFDNRDLPGLMIPYIVAGVISTAAFYFVAMTLALGGYLLEGNVQQLAALGAGAAVTYILDTVNGYMHIEGLVDAMNRGFLLSMLFGGVSAFVGIAIGAQAAEQRLDLTDEMYELHDAVWESSTTSIILCLLIAYIV
ncbi:MAG: hypothetical protein H7X80_04635 [bacterium]|nr:hypothetical protein [Candidatus Kapabacteria bacterium]